MHQRSRDPNETTDLGSDPKYAEEIKALIAKLYSYGKDGPPPAPGSDDGDSTDAECKVVVETGSWQPWEAVL